MPCLRNLASTATLIEKHIALKKDHPMQTLSSPFTVTPLPAFDDNYIWCIESAQSNSFIVVDPGDAQVVISHGLKIQKSVSAILVTHHHADHTGGIEALLEHFPDIPVYGPANSPFQGISNTLQQSNTVKVFGADFDVLEIPGHTLDHIAYYNDQLGLLFCGDTLFLAGCGRVFEGTPEQMHNSLSKIMALPATTKAYPTHEYSLANLDFAMAVDGNNKALQKVQQECLDKRALDQVTLPTSLGQEANINPFVRTHDEAVIKSAQNYMNHALNQPSEVFAALRSWKNRF